jgi:Lrp/AsnC family transcriptional regulator, regulator of ectoine-degradation genes
MITKNLHHIGPECIDHIDINIIAALSKNARISKVEMSDEVGVSAGRCYERMRRLEKSGIVRGYHADIDIARVASCLQFLTQIKLANDTASQAKQFERAVLKTPEVILCQSVLGHIDYIAVMIAPSIERYQHLIEELRTQSANQFEFVTFPISNLVKMPGQSDFRQILGRLTRSASSEN